MEPRAELKGQNAQWGKWKVALIAINVIVLAVVVIAIVTYLSIYPKLKYFHHYYNNSPPTAAQILYENAVANTNTFNTSIINSSVCKPLTNKMCTNKTMPYKYYTLPNIFEHKLLETAVRKLNSFSHVVDLKCYTLLPLLLCASFLPKCSPNAENPTPPCRGLCTKAKRRCEFFMGVYHLDWPEELDCDTLPESSNEDICIGQKQFLEQLNLNKECNDGLTCDNRSRCVGRKWVCDGHSDCQDGSDELDCGLCNEDEFSCQRHQCIDKGKVCDGRQDCPNNRDELYCYRLADGAMGDTGIGRLEAYDERTKLWHTVCPHGFDRRKRKAICLALGYRKLVSGKVQKSSEQFVQTVVVDWAASNSKQLKTLPLGSTSKMLTEKCGWNNHHVLLECKEIECGVSNIGGKMKLRQNRIVGGEEAEPGSWPWLVGLHGGKEHVFFCGGVLISDSWVMSTGHCVGHQNISSELVIAIGGTRRTSYSTYNQQRGIKRLIKHPDFVSDSNKLDNDLVLFQLDRPVEFNPHIRPACLPKYRVEPGLKCSMIGWGKPKEGYDVGYKTAINKVEVPILSHDTCQLWYSAKFYTLTDSMLCAGYEEGGKDACQGDSGGPLLCNENGHWFVAGLASWGYGCAQPFYPGVYTNVYKFVPWIQEVMNSHSSD